MSSVMSSKCAKIKAISVTELWHTQLFAAVPTHKTKLKQLQRNFDRLN
jgi:hypothetical protein